MSHLSTLFAIKQPVASTRLEKAMRNIEGSAVQMDSGDAIFGMHFQKNSTFHKYLISIHAVNAKMTMVMTAASRVPQLQPPFIFLFRIVNFF